MPEMLKGGFIVSLGLKFISVFVNAYNNSLLKKFVDKVYFCFKQSVVRKVMSSYANKQPWFRYSLIYKFIMFLAKIADIIFGFIHKVIKKCLFGSRVAEGYKNIVAMSKIDKCYSAGVLLTSLPIGVMLGSIVFKNCTALTFVICWGMFFLGVMIVLVGIYGRDSFIVKLIRNFIAAIK